MINKENVFMLIGLLGCLIMMLAFCVLGELGLTLLTVGLGLLTISLYGIIFDLGKPTYQEDDILDADLLATLKWQDELMEQDRIWNEEVTNSILEQNK